MIVDLSAADEQVSDSHATVVRRDGHRLCLGFDPQQVSPAELIARITARHAVRDLFVENPPIENIVAQLYECAAAEAVAASAE